MAKLSRLYSVKQINSMRQDLIDKHGNNCAICKKPRKDFKKNLSVDHAHKSGRIRGLLCYYCNRRLVGRHTLETAKQVYEYLLKYDLPEKK